MTPKTIIFIGPQGSGKGTQVELLQHTLASNSDSAAVVDIQTGRLFRALATQGTYAGARVGELINTGKLVPDTFTNAMWIADMKDRLTADAHLLIDGFPRTLVQAAVVDEMMEFFARTDVQIINLDTPQAVVIERMMERGRDDDTPEYIKERLSQYHSDTLPVLAYYREKSHVTVHDINGAHTPEGVHAAICAAIGV